MSLSDFEHILISLKPYTNKLSFHLLGDPFTIVNLEEFLQTANNYGFKIELTTSGFWLANQPQTILNKITQLNISLNSASNLSDTKIREYMYNVFKWCDYKIEFAPKPFINLRLWNQDGDEKDNQFTQKILSILYNYFKVNNEQLASKIRVNYDRYFKWPSLENEFAGDGFCHGGSVQLGILNDGSVVPCCLDYNGEINFGNINTTPLSEILQTKRYLTLVESFKSNKASEELCQKCSFKDRFQASSRF